jgi:glycosyltransferase involved in cell wall biosynthesis
LYTVATAVLCTSDYEGFPNTFLEAWSHGLPVVSSFDPDGLIESRALGATAVDAAGLAAAVRDLVASPERWRVASRRSRRYYSESHTVDGAMAAFERLLLELTAARPASALDAGR